MDILLSILSLLGFVLLTASTGLFVAIEFALTSLERSTIETEVKERGDKNLGRYNAIIKISPSSCLVPN